MGISRVAFVAEKLNEIHTYMGGRLVISMFLGITLSAAEILGIQGKVGSLEVGKEANLVVLQEDPLQVDKMRIRDIKIVNRVFRGAKC